MVLGVTGRSTGPPVLWLGNLLVCPSCPRLGVFPLLMSSGGEHEGGFCWLVSGLLQFLQVLPRLWNHSFCLHGGLAVPVSRSQWLLHRFIFLTTLAEFIVRKDSIDVSFWNWMLKTWEIWQLDMDSNWGLLQISSCQSHWDCWEGQSFLSAVFLIL